MVMLERRCCGAQLPAKHVYAGIAGQGAEIGAGLATEDCGGTSRGIDYSSIPLTY